MWEIAPNPGIIKIYTSGCPKNQNKCWYRIGSPPPAGSKNEVFRFRSVSNIVIAPAKTGKERRRSTTVIVTAHTNSGMRSNRNPCHRILITVVIKFTAPRMDEAPARWREKIARSTDGPACARFLDSGGYTVQPVPAPFSTAAEDRRSIREGGRSQNLMLLSRGNAISGAPSIKGNSQFPKPPMNTGITRKKIIRNAWAVTIVLYNWSLPKNEPGCLSSIRINRLIAAPIIPAQTPKIKYRVPISLWLVEYNHRIYYFDQSRDPSFHSWINPIIKMIRNVKLLSTIAVILVMFISSGIGISSTISISNTIKIIANRKNRKEKGTRALWLGSNPHSNGEDFSRSLFDRAANIQARRNTISGIIMAVIDEHNIRIWP